MLDLIPVDTCAVGVGPNHVGGFSNIGCNYGLEGRLWIARRAEGDTLTDFRLGPVISAGPIGGSAAPVKVWGGFLAAGWSPADYRTLAERGHLLLARTSDWEMREIPGPPGFEMGFSTLTDQYLYALPLAPASRHATHIYRYELAKFEQLGERIEPVAEPLRVEGTGRRR